MPDQPELYCIAPFRIPFNLNTAYAASNPDALIVGNDTSRSLFGLPDLQFLPLPNRQSDKTKYTSLAESSAQLPTPYFACIDLMQQSSAQTSAVTAVINQSEFTLLQCKMYLCDNSIGLLDFQVSLDWHLAETDAKSLDKRTAAFAESTVAVLSETLLEPLSELLVTLDPRLFRHNSEDYAFAVAPDQTETFGRPFWVSRLLAVSQLDSYEHQSFLGRWAPDAMTLDAVSAETSSPVRLCWGNSVAIGEHGLEPKAYFLAANLAQYFYVCFDVLNRRSLTQYNALSNSNYYQEFSAIRSAARAIQTQVHLVQYDLEDTRQEVQGATREYLNALVSAQKLDKLMWTAQQRSEFLTQRVQDQAKLYTERRERHIQMLLAVLSVFAAIDFFNNLMWFSFSYQTETGHSVRGTYNALGILERLGADISLALSMILLGGVALLIFRLFKKR